jgi:hypothetical protein
VRHLSSPCVNREDYPYGPKPKVIQASVPLHGSSRKNMRAAGGLCRGPSTSGLQGRFQACVRRDPGYARYGLIKHRRSSMKTITWTLSYVDFYGPRARHGSQGLIRVSMLSGSVDVSGVYFIASPDSATYCNATVLVPEPNSTLLIVCGGVLRGGCWISRLFTPKSP